MNDLQEAKLNMYRSTQKICADNSTILAANPAFNTAYGVLNAKVNILFNAIIAESKVITGITADKAVLRETLCKSVADVASMVFAYASKTGNNTLKEQVNFSLTDLRRIKDDLLVPNCNQIHQAANANLAALGTYGVTAAMLSIVRTNMTNYHNAVAAPKTAKATKQTQTENIKITMDEIDDLLKNQMDKLIVSFKAAYPDFVTSYKNARVIIDPATRHQAEMSEATF